jgi:hypothetical protein
VRLRVAFAKLAQDNPNLTRAMAASQMGVSKATITSLFKEFGLGYRKGLGILLKSINSKANLLNSDYSDWGQWLSSEVVEAHTTLLDRIDITEEVKAVTVAESMEPLTGHQVSALFTAIGREPTEYTIELLKLNLALQIPKPEQPEMKLEEIGEELSDVVDGLRYLAKYPCMTSMRAVRALHDKDTLVKASARLTASEQAVIKKLVVTINEFDNMDGTYEHSQKVAT